MTLPLGYLLAGITTVIWGLIVVAVKRARTPGYLGVAISMPVGVLTLLLLSVCARQTLALPISLWSFAGLGLLLGGLLQFPLGTLFYYESLKRADLSTAAPLTRLTTIFVAGMAFGLGLERFSVAIGGASIIAVLGAMLLMSPAAAPGTPRCAQHVSGVVCAILASVCWALGNIVIRQVLTALPPLATTFYALLFGTVIYYVVLLATGQAPRLLAIPRADLWRYLAHGVLSCGLGYFLFFTTIQILGVTRATIITTSWPLISTMAGVMIYQEILTRRKIAGILLIMASVLLTL